MEQGMITLRRSGLIKIKAGITSIEEVAPRNGQGLGAAAMTAGHPGSPAEDASSRTPATCTSRPTSRRGIRVHGVLKSIDHPPLTPAETKQLIYSLLTDKQKKQFEEKLELDFSFGIKDLGRFRANVFMQKGAVAGGHPPLPAVDVELPEAGHPARGSPSSATCRGASSSSPGRPAAASRPPWPA